MSKLEVYCTKCGNQIFAFQGLVSLAKCEECKKKEFTKSPEIAGLWANVSSKYKPELSALMYQREHLDIQLNRLRAALAAHQDHQPTVQGQIFGLPSVLAEVMLKPALSVLQRELQRQDRRLNPHQQERNQYPMSLGFVAANLYLVVATLEASDSLQQALNPIRLDDFYSYVFLKKFLGL